MQTRALRTLVTISNVGSFVVAAEQMGRTLSAVSMQMKALEQELGVTLFDRTHRPPRLTPVGRAIAQEADALLQQEDRVLEICRPSEQLVGRFKIGFVTTAAVRLLPGFLREAAVRAPLARFELETGLSETLQDKVMTGQLDAAVITNAGGLPDRLSTRLLRREPFVFAAHADLASQGLDGLLRHQTFFHFRPETGIGKLIAGAMAQSERPASAPSIVLDDLEAIMECVAAGLGFTLLPVPDVERYLTRRIVTLDGPEALERKLVLSVMKQGPLAQRQDVLQALFEVQ